MNRKYSLKQNKEIEQLVRYKISVGNKYYAIYYHKHDGEPQIAFSVSKKNGNAVERNYQKRVIKEIVRSNIDSLKGLKILIIVKPSSKDLSFGEKKENIEYLINKIRKEIKWWEKTLYISWDIYLL